MITKMLKKFLTLFLVCFTAFGFSSANYISLSVPIDEEFEILDGYDYSIDSINLSISPTSLAEVKEVFNSDIDGCEFDEDCINDLDLDMRIDLYFNDTFYTVYSNHYNYENGEFDGNTVTLPIELNLTPGDYHLGGDFFPLEFVDSVGVTIGSVSNNLEEPENPGLGGGDIPSGGDTPSGGGSSLLGLFSPILTTLGTTIGEFIPYVIYIGIGILVAVIGFVAIKRLVNWVRSKIFSSFK